MQPPIELRLGVSRAASRPDTYFLFARGALEGFEDTLSDMGFTYDPVKDGFKRPFDCDIIDLMKKHPLNYDISINVLNQYKYEKEKIKPYPYFSSSDLKVKLYPFQEEGKNFILHTGSCIIADEMGLGKTVQALAAAEHWGAKCLVVTRASLLRQWETEIGKFTHSTYEIIEGPPKKREKLWDSALRTPAHYAVISYDTLTAKLDLEAAQKYIANGGMAIYDEITMVKNFLTRRNRAINLLHPHVTIGLTGTPYENHLDEYYQIFALVRPRLLPPIRVYQELFTVRESRDIKTKSGRTFKLEKIVKEINLDILKKMVAPAMLRRERNEVLTLPPSEPVVHKVGMSRLQREVEALLMRAAKKHEEFKLPFFTYGLENAITPGMLQSHKMPENIDVWPLIEKLEALEALEGEERDKAAMTPRISEIGNILDEAGESKVVIYSRFTTALDIIDRLILKHRDIQGAYFTGFARESKMFLEGGCRVLLMSGAGAYGLNLQEVCHLMVLVDKPFNPAVLDQVKGRIDRIGQENPMQYHEFDTGSTIEQRAYDIINRKGNTSDILLARDVL